MALAHHPDMVLPSTDLLQKLQALREDVVQRGQQLASSWAQDIERDEFRNSALNLAYYLALRQYDLREVQQQLMPWGLSSLGRSESRVLETIDNVIATLRCVCEQSPRVEPCTPSAFFRGDDVLDLEMERVLGAGSPGRRARIMVTFPTEAATDYDLVRDMLANGMNVARLNCAHDTSTEWLAMIENIRRAEQETGLACKVAMDLAGPKIRVEATSFRRKRRFFKGDTLLLTDGLTKSRKFPYQVTCSLQGAVSSLQVGDDVWFDDGLIGAVVESLHREGAALRVEHVQLEGERIRAEKGINFPDTDLRVTALTDKDLEDLDFVAQHADIVEYSFVQTVDDMKRLQAELRKRIDDPVRLANLAIVAKIETRKAVQNLPQIIVAGAGVQPFGVMIARGDLAVEIGFERLAEIQEELLWVCEAAHTPVIWATQVFENFVKTGVPTRSEITDAAMSERAECAMLNKGQFVADAVRLLDHVIVRMQGHQFKKRAELRALKSWPIE